MCVAENTLREVSVELSAVSGQQRRRTQRSCLEKVAMPLFRQSQPARVCTRTGSFYFMPLFFDVRAVKLRQEGDNAPAGERRGEVGLNAR